MKFGLSSMQRQRKFRKRSAVLLLAMWTWMAMDADSKLMISYLVNRAMLAILSTGTDARMLWHVRVASSYRILLKATRNFHCNQWA